jgi:phage tail sheath protein FI
LSDPHDQGITVTEIAPMDQPIAASPETTAAFVGRALRGPVNTPVLIRKFADFRRRFGDFWPGSCLGEAVEQFFDHGGRQIYVVRVANNARGAMICLPASHGVLVLRALEPGSTEHIRAAVDYDGIDELEKSLFNLTVQRVAPDTNLVLDQEIYRRLTCEPGQERSVEDVLVTSSLVRAQGPLPAQRPASTDAEYVEPAQTGTDGLALSDYDLVGSASNGTGMFALNQVEGVDLLYMPPPDAGRVPGPAAVLAAELYCRRRGAMLILDPPEEWSCSYDAIRGMRDAGYANPDVLSYFPRVNLRGDESGPLLPVGGAIAGLLCKLDRQHGPWEDLDQRGFALSRDLVPAIDIFSSDAHQLVKAGLNVVAGQAPGHTMVCGSVTLAHGTQSSGDFANLTTRRLCLLITNAIDRATRWAVFEPSATAAREKIVSKIHAFMCALSDAGAFRDDHFMVQCDAGSRRKPVDPDRGITILLAFNPACSDETISLTLHQTASGCRVAKTAFAPVRADVA